MNGDVIRTITIRGTSEGLDKLQTDLTNLAAAHKDVAIAAEETDRKTLSLEQAWKRQTLRLDEAARAQANIARETKVADAALREGLATQAQHVQRLDQINQRYTTTATSTKAFTQQTGLARHELVNLSRQAQDVGVSLASGQSPFTVLIQQGSQIADVFASSGGTLRGFFSQAMEGAGRFLSSWGGIATVVAAVGAAAVYAAMQFRKASTTIEEALERRNQLLTIGHSLQATSLLLLNNEIDLQAKLAVEMEKIAKFAERKGTTPTQVAGEMGVAPTGVAPLQGFEKVNEAVQAFQNRMPGAQNSAQLFMTTISQIGATQPEVKELIDELLKMGEVAVKIENAAAASARLRDLMLELAQVYPGITFETAKQLQLLEAQLEVVRARTEQEMLSAQYNLSLVQSLQQGLSAAEATAIASAKRAIAEETASAALEKSGVAASKLSVTYDLLGRQIDEMVLGYDLLGRQIEKNAVAETAAAANSVQQTAKQTQATRELTSAQKEARANWDYYVEGKGRGPQAGPIDLKQYERGIEDLAAAMAAGTQATNKHAEAADNSSQATQHNTQVTVQANQAFDALTGHILDYTDSIRFWATTMADEINKVMSMGFPSQFTDSSGTRNQYVSSYDPLSLQRRKQAYEEAGTPTKMMTHGIPGTLGAFQYAVPDFGAINDNLSNLFKSENELTKSTDRLNETMQNALSPFYSQDPRTTKLGFRAGVTGNQDWLTGATNANPLVAVLGAGATAPGMAEGGSFVVGGGNSANDNRMAVFPVASGEEIVVNRNKGGRGGSQVVHIDNRIIVNGSIDEDTMSRMKVSRFQQAQRMRGQLAQA